MYAILDKKRGKHMKKHGGARSGAGRPKGQGRFKEPTKPIRIPISMINKVNNLINKHDKIPIFTQSVQAGFPVTIDDNSFEQVNLNELIIKHPTATFLLKATGESMTGAGIHPNDMLVVDRSIAAKNTKIIIASIDGELTVKRLIITGNETILASENPNYPNIKIQSHHDFKIWGVVTMVLHQL